MIPTIQFEEARFSEVGVRIVEHELSDGVRLAQACFLEELLGVVFGSITLWYLVSSIASLA
jgi:hypothetical protein